MSNRHTISLTVPTYLSDWAVWHWHGKEKTIEPFRGDLVCSYMKMHLTDHNIDKCSDEATLFVLVPRFRDLDTRKFHFMTQRYRTGLKKLIRMMFLHDYMTCMLRQPLTRYPLYENIERWMHARKIEYNDKNYESLRKIYFRNAKIVKKY